MDEVSSWNLYKWKLPSFINGQMSNENNAKKPNEPSSQSIPFFEQYTPFSYTSSVNAEKCPDFYKLNLAWGKYYGYFQTAGLFNKHKLIAEIANFFTRTATYAYMGSVKGASGGSALCPVAGAAAGAYYGAVSGVCVSLLSGTMKPIAAYINRQQRHESFKQAEHFMRAFQETTLGTDPIEKIKKFEDLLKNSENAMLNFIFLEWTYKEIESKPEGARTEQEKLILEDVKDRFKKKDGDYLKMRAVLEQGILGSSFLNQKTQELQNQFIAILDSNFNKVTHENLNEFLDFDDAKIDVKLNHVQKTYTEAFWLAYANQFSSYNLSRLPAALLGSIASLIFGETVLPEDIVNAVCLPFCIIAATLISTSNNEYIKDFKEFMLSPLMVGVNTTFALLTMIAKLVPTSKIEECILHGLHGVGLLSLFFSIGIHSIKEYFLLDYDESVRKRFLTKSQNDEKNNTNFALGHDLARLARNDVTKHIPSSLKKLRDIISELKTMKEPITEDKKNKKIEEFKTALLKVSLSIKTLEKYAKYIHNNETATEIETENEIETEITEFPTPINSPCENSVQTTVQATVQATVQTTDQTREESGSPVLI